MGQVIRGCMSASPSGLYRSRRRYPLRAPYVGGYVDCTAASTSVTGRLTEVPNVICPKWYSRCLGEMTRGARIWLSICSRQHANTVDSRYYSAQNARSMVSVALQ